MLDAYYVLLCGATEMNGKFLGQDFNLLDRLLVTAYDPISAFVDSTAQGK